MKEVILNSKKMILQASVLWFILSAISVLIYKALWGDYNYTAWSWKFVLLILLGTILHEFIHALFFSFYNPKGWKGIKAGILIKKFIPYCCCTEPVKVKHSRIAGIMPVILTGFIPYIISMYIGNYTLMYLSVMLIAGGYGDIVILYNMKNLNPNDYIYDLEKEIGFKVIDNNNV